MATKLRSRPFKEAHLDVFMVEEAHRSECYGGMKYLAHLGKSLQLGTHMLDGRILYISGYYQVLPGVLEVFMHPSIYVKDHPITVIRDVRWWLKYMTDEHRARRLQTWGADTPESERWLTALGFVKEGVLDSYLPDGTAMLIWGRTCKA